MIQQEPLRQRAYTTISYAPSQMERSRSTIEPYSRQNFIIPKAGSLVDTNYIEARNSMQPGMGHNLVNKYRNIVETEHIIDQGKQH